LHETHLVFRRQLIPPAAALDGGPSLETQLVKFNEVPKLLGEKLKRVSVAERTQQLTQRLAEFQLRFVDH
jgi:hypothetical protein